MDKAVYGRYRGLLYNKIPDLQGKATKSWWYVCHLKGWLPFIWHRRVLDKLLSNRTQQFSRRTKDLQVIHCGWRKQCCNSGGPCLFRHIHNYQENHGWVGTTSKILHEQFHTLHMPNMFARWVSRLFMSCQKKHLAKASALIWTFAMLLKTISLVWLLWTNVGYISMPVKQKSRANNSQTGYCGRMFVTSLCPWNKHQTKQLKNFYSSPQRRYPWWKRPCFLFFWGCSRIRLTDYFPHGHIINPCSTKAYCRSYKKV